MRVSAISILVALLSPTILATSTSTISNYINSPQPPAPSNTQPPVAEFTPTLVRAVSSEPTSILQEEQHHNHLEIRQGVGAAGGQAGLSPKATQMSPTTIYMIHGVNGDKTPVAFTQLFSKTPDPWPAPTQGVIGLGTIVGEIGVVKSNRKRSLPTHVAEVKGIVRQFAKREKSVKGQADDVDSVNGGAGVKVQKGLVAISLIVAGGLCSGGLFGL